MYIHNEDITILYLAKSSNDLNIFKINLGLLILLCAKGEGVRYVALSRSYHEQT
jgi:hypothetical protein